MPSIGLRTASQTPKRRSRICQRVGLVMAKRTLNFVAVVTRALVGIHGIDVSAKEADHHCHCQDRDSGHGRLPSLGRADLVADSNLKLNFHCENPVMVSSPDCHRATNFGPGDRRKSSRGSSTEREQVDVFILTRGSRVVDDKVRTCLGPGIAAAVKQPPKRFP